MSTDFSIKPVGAPVATPIVKPAPEAVRTAVQTELPASQTVGATDSSLRPAPVNTPPPNDEVAHQVVIDRAAAEIVYRVVDRTTNLVVSQFPDDSRLRARAYLRAEANAKLDNKALATDRKV
jgi:hypothetical protein